MPSSTRSSATYGRQHRTARKRALDRLHDGDPCARCGKPMFRGQLLDLDHHDDDPSIYRGLAHQRCNRRAGAIKGNRKRRITVWRSRAW